MPDNNQVFLLSRRWPHHSGHSGYDLFGRYVGQPLTAKPIPSFFVPDRAFFRITRDMPGYDLMGLGLELRAMRHMATHRNCVYHILYGDNGFYFLGRLNGWRGHRVVASFHYPPRRFASEVRNKENLANLSAVVVVGTNQISSFAGLLPEDRIFFVPYPIDTSFFVPPADFDDREENLCLFVGMHLRDLDTLRLVIEDAWVRAPQLKFVVVAHPDHLKIFEGVVGNLIVRSRIGEDELLDLYQKATLLLQPLQDATANTTIMEAIACGLPMVVTDLVAVRDYVHEDCAEFIPPYDSEAMLSAILRLIEDREQRKRMAVAARERACALEWSIVAPQMNEIYDKVRS